MIKKSKEEENKNKEDKFDAAVKRMLKTPPKLKMRKSKLKMIKSKKEVETK